MYIKYFAWTKEISGKEKENINFKKINNVNELVLYLKEKYPKFKKHFENKTLRIAVNQEYTNTNKKINENDEIALFPPVSGG